MSKLSRYNIKIGRGYYYNSFSDSIIKLNEDAEKAIMNDKIIDDKNTAVEILKSQGFILQDETEELDNVLFTHNSAKYNTKRASFMLYPSLICNFNCYYCFEKHKSSIISESNTELLTKSLVNFIEKERLSNVSIRWSGGEPLLAWQPIKDILTTLKKRIGVELSNSITTNGYLLSKSIAKEMLDSDFKRVVITIDGPKRMHDESRKTKDGKPTFETIVKNIEYLSEYIPVTIRVNVDRNNYTTIEELLQELNIRHLSNKKISLLCRPIVSCWDCKKDETMFKMSEFFELEKQYIHLANKYGFNYEYHPNIKSGIRCIYYHIYSFIVDPDLNVYKCPHFVGDKEKAIGTINNDILLYENTYHQYLKAINTNPFEIEECKNCKILPLCYGKCPIEWEHCGCNENEGCIPEKETIIEKIKYEYKI
jgi:uncharacterized protein